MPDHKCFLLSGNIGMLLLAGLLFTANVKTPIAHSAYSEACPPSQSYGRDNTWVQVIQFTLNQTAIPDGPLATDGQFGTKTKSAVDWYQKNVMFITNSGDVIGDRTWASPGFCTGFNGFIIFHSGQHLTVPNCPGPLSYGSNGTWVQALQQALNMDVLAPPGFGPISPTYNGDHWWPLQLDGQFGTILRMPSKLSRQQTASRKTAV